MKPEKPIVHRGWKVYGRSRAEIEWLFTRMAKAMLRAEVTAARKTKKPRGQS